MRTTGIRLIANVTQYLRELKRSGDATRGLGDDLDKARIKGIRMANDLAEVSKASSAELTNMVHSVQKLDEEILKTRKSIASLAQGFAGSGDADVFKELASQQKRLKSLMNVRNLLPDPRLIADAGEKAASVFAGGFGNKFQMRLVTAAIPAMVALTPFLSAAVAGAVIGGAGLGGVIGGIILAARDERVKTAGAALGQFILGDLERRATRFVTPTLNSIERIRMAWVAMGPDLDRIFGASRWVEALTEAGLKGGKALVSGLGVAVEKGDPVMAAFGNMFTQVGITLGRFFVDMSDHADVGAMALNDLSVAVDHLALSFTGFIETGAAIYEATGALDVYIDRARYWIEDNNQMLEGLGGLNEKLDLTADGFKKGSVEAEAYRKATLGTADAADFAILRHAGMTDAQIAATDASGLYRAELGKVDSAITGAATKQATLKELQAAVTGAQKLVTLATKEYKASLDALGPAGGQAIDLMNGLKTAQENLYGANMSAVDSNIAYEASLDSLSNSVKDNGTSLTIRAKAGRENTIAFADLLKKSNEMYFANIAQGMSTDEARTKHEARTRAIIKEAEKLKLNKTRTAELIATYGQIPNDRTTKIIQTGLEKIAGAMGELYIAQRALADGITVAEARKQALAKNSSPVFKGWHEGGWTGPGPKMQKAGDVHADEFVIKKSSRRSIERSNPGLLRELNATGQMPGYARGGLVAPVETRDFPFKVNLGKTELMSMQQALSKVAPSFGNWPGSPGSQRGDSGVWRKIVSLIRSTGPMSGSFGNAYRPGDPKWHGSGRAVDWMGYNQDALSSFLVAKRPLEFIHRTNQRDYAYTRGVNKGSFNNALMEAHRNHIHIAMANGGVIPEPVIGMGASGRTYSFAERGPEVVLPNGTAFGGGGSTVTIAPTIVIQGSGNPDQVADRVNRKIGALADLYSRS